MRLLPITLLATFLASPALAAERDAIFSVSNMTCALCPITVKSVIAQVDGVISVVIDQELARATVHYDDALATADAIAAAATKAGYPAVQAQ